jgi:hypothetical protein
MGAITHQKSGEANLKHFHTIFTSYPMLITQISATMAMPARNGFWKSADFRESVDSPNIILFRAWHEIMPFFIV